ncbi:MAG TPA: pseudouridine synthase [Longimicrobiales bacterium]|nr:pseudouridine synthase [Longimicrobiales bacterium]
MRLQKFLSRAGVASRRAAEHLMAEGRVQVNDTVASELGTRVDPARDVVRVDGRRVDIAPATWIALHKPHGYVSTRSDPRGRPTVYDLLPPELGGLFYVGRLDYLSEGLLLFTNQGDVAHRLLHPSFAIERVYDIRVEGEVADEAVGRLLRGIELEDGVARARRAVKMPTRRAEQGRVQITLEEGRNREVRRMFAALGYRVQRLVRVRYGPVRLGDLPVGEWRELDADEVRALSRTGKERPGGKERPPGRPAEQGGPRGRGKGRGARGRRPPAGDGS